MSRYLVYISFQPDYLSCELFENGTVLLCVYVQYKTQLELYTGMPLDVTKFTVLFNNGFSVSVSNSS